MAFGENGATGRSTTRAREALIEGGALIPACRPQNLLDIVATPAPERSQALTDILLEMRDDDHVDRHRRGIETAAGSLSGTFSPGCLDDRGESWPK